MFEAGRVSITGSSECDEGKCIFKYKLLTPLRQDQPAPLRPDHLMPLRPDQPAPLRSDQPVPLGPDQSAPLRPDLLTRLRPDQPHPSGWTSQRLSRQDKPLPPLRLEQPPPPSLRQHQPLPLGSDQPPPRLELDPQLAGLGHTVICRWSRLWLCAFHHDETLFQLSQLALVSHQFLTDAEHQPPLDMENQPPVTQSISLHVTVVCG